VARKKSKKSKKGNTNRIVTIIVTIGAVMLLGYYLLTGSDPLGLFESAETEPQLQEEVVPTPEEVAPVEDAPATASGADWYRVYFTDPNTINDPENLTGSIPEKLIELINTAQHTIHIASFEFNLTPVAEALIAAHERGVEVQWVTDDEHGIDADFEDDHGQFEMLEDAGIEIVDDGRSALMHNKFWIFDGQAVWTGSTNITINGNFKNNNNVIVVRSTKLAAIYEREFQEMWADGEFGPRSPSTVDQQSLTLDGTQIQVIFSAEDEAMDILIPMIQKTQKSIRFMAFSFTHDDLGAAVLAQAEAGVDISGIFETRGSETEYSELGHLFCAGYPVRQDGNKRTFHHKVFVLDGETVITGSLNFSDNANDSNDENVIIVHNKEIAALYLQEFDRRWAEAGDPDPADLECK
jgi:phosphatidylserine/phosphatidylglycerophosphate/cardiolipin synthase-like enzyme